MPPVSAFMFKQEVVRILGNGERHVIACSAEINGRDCFPQDPTHHSGHGAINGSDTTKSFTDSPYGLLLVTINFA